MNGRTIRSAGAIIVVVIIAAAVAAATVSLTVARKTARLQAERNSAASAAEAVTTVASAFRTKLAAAAAAEASGPRGGNQPNQPGAPDNEDLATTVVARDSGQPVIDDSANGVIVTALYDGVSVPSTVQDRRDHVVGFRAVPLDLAPVLTAVAPPGGGIAVTGPDGSVISVPSRRPASAASDTTQLGSDLPPGWSLTVWTPVQPISTGRWLLALLFLLVGAAVALYAVRRRASSEQVREQLRRLDKESSTVAALATLAQHSLDLGEVLPAVTTELATSLGLVGAAIVVPTARGERTVFTWGRDIDEAGSEQGLGALHAGESRVLMLSRGGRVVARLQVAAGRDLNCHEMRTLAAAGDVLTSALSNAEAYTEQVELVKRMVTVDKLKTVFLATASHELRTPVTAISGYAGLLHARWDELSPVQARDCVERLDEVSHRLTGLVEDMLDFSRLQTGSGPAVETTVFDLGETVAELLDEQLELAPSHEVVYRPVDGLYVKGSRRAVERVLVNLVGNAAKYSPVGSQIRVVVRKAGDRAALVVEDQGPGIPVEDRARVFSPFYRGHGDEVLRTSGAGLGLAIVTEFAHSMNGEVSVNGAPSGGASFVASFPITTPAPEPEPEHTPEPERTPEPIPGDVHVQV